MEKKPPPPDRNGESSKESRSSARELAARLIELSGGPDNVAEASHCTTRIRLKLKNSTMADEAGLTGLQEVQSVFIRTGHLQIILGPAIVIKIHRQIARILEEHMVSPEQVEEQPYGLPEQIEQKAFNAPVSAPAPSLQDWKKRVRTTWGNKGLIRRIMDAVFLFSDIVVPMIPLFVAVGLLLGLLGMIQAFGWVPQDSIYIRTLSLLTGSAFQGMAVMFGYQAAKRLGGIPPLGAAIGLLMTRPDLVWTLESSGVQTGRTGILSAPQFGYQGTVIPIILAVLLMTLVDKGLRRIIPSSAAIIVIPFLSFIIGGSLGVLVIGPLATELGGVLSSSLEQVFKHGSTLFGLLLGGAYSTIVMSGLHQGIQAIEVGLISNPEIGVNFLLPIWSMANIAQGGAGLAVYFLTKDDALKKIALPASFTAFLGVTEPIAFGVNLKLGRPFLGAAVGGAAGGAYVAFHQVVANSFGLTGIPMIAFIVLPGYINLFHYLIGFLLAAGTAFAVTWILGVKNHENQKNS
ncbi:PTS transporter subunit EIIC [Paenibacillus typhae]|uniref:PTS transporter subunit EIIC n=1 Tax=Paenibacillus typhae TaxID=1174501 RepID=UPI001C8E2987|nr:PTS transporter subunit EIIC [Paenibacillus typhae]MBY0013266.1 PTS transporter subunit EIIC [Paenibacillus typhae]